MKILFILLTAFLFLSNTAFTQDNPDKVQREDVQSTAVPLTMSYQGVLTDLNGTIVPDNIYVLTFRIYNALTAGTMLWEEMQNVQVTKGLFNVMLGKINPMNLPFDVPYYLAVRIAMGSELEPRTELAASPFSFMSKGIFDNAVTTSKITDGAVTQSKLAAGLTIPPGGNAGGDLAGTYPNPLVGKLQGRSVSSNAPSSGQVLSWNGSQWIPSTPSSGMGGSGSVGYISKFTAANNIGNSILLEYNNNLAIKRLSATYTIDIGTTSLSDNFMRFTSSARSGIMFADASEYSGGIFYIHDGDYMQFAATGSSYGEKMRLTGKGNLGIGTTNPIGKIHAKSNGKYAGYFESDSLSDDTFVIYAKFTGTGDLDATGVTGEAVPEYGSGKGGEFTGGYRGVSGYGDGGTYNYSVFGVYGSATGAPGTRIGVYGTTSGAAATTYGVYSSGDLAYTGSLLHVSDQKFKTNITGFSNTLDKVMQLEPRMFSYTTDPKYSHMNLPAGTHYGLIGQELEKIFPEMVKDAVHPSESKGSEEIKYKGVMINELIPVLIQAIKEQELKIEKLEKEIEQLKK